MKSFKVTTFIGKSLIFHNHNIKNATTKTIAAQLQDATTTWMEANFNFKTDTEKFLALTLKTWRHMNFLTTTKLFTAKVVSDQAENLQSKSKNESFEAEADLTSKL